MRLPFAIALLISTAFSAHAQYKVVGPDGRITYTDRPVAPAIGSQVQTMRTGGVPGQGAAAAALPLELRNVVMRFPVTLYTGTECPPCDSARKLLQQRGVPFAERTISTEDDANALLRVTGGRSLPSLMVGNQALRGLLDTEWASTLDLAGYPRESKLPRNYQAPPAMPLVVRPPAVAEAAAPTRPPADLPAAAAPASGIRF